MLQDSRDHQFYSKTRTARLTVVILTAWSLLCAIVIVCGVTQMEPAAQQLLLLYFQPLLPSIFMLWLWSINVGHFEAYQVDYELCFNSKERKYLLPAKELRKVAVTSAAGVLTCAAAFTALSTAGLYTAAAWLPLAAYVYLAVLLVLPLNMLHRPTRLFFAETIQRVLMPFQTVTWADFLLADIFTSLAKSTYDFAKVTCSFATGPAMKHLVIPYHKDLAICQPLAVPMLLALCLPYIIRFIQCINVYRTTGKTAQIFNAIKYASAFPALVLSMLEHEYHIHQLEFKYQNLWVGVMLFNCIYSYYWDVEQDWDMPWLQQPGATRVGPVRLPSFKQDSMYSRWFYRWALVSNAVLRMTWIHRLIGNLEKLNTVALLLALLEAFRRYQWVYVRIETELRKIKVEVAHGHESPSKPAGGALQQ